MLLFFAFLIVIGFIFSQVFASRSILYIFLGISLVMNFLSYFYSDKMVLMLTRAKPLSQKEAPEVYEIVERLAKKYDMPRPPIYLTPEEQANAFATGRDEKHAAVAVTRGILAMLDKDELEGVLAHELSHVKNRDILVGTVAVMLAGVIAVLSDVFIRLTFFGGYRSRDDRDSGGGFAFALAMIAAILAPIAATMIQLGISRSRESLADVSGATLTKKPGELVNALIKISRDPRPLSHASSATNHLYISNPVKGRRANWLAKLFLTHPPMEERIKALRSLKI